MANNAQGKSTNKGGKEGKSKKPMPNQLSTRLAEAYGELGTIVGRQRGELTKYVNEELYPIWREEKVPQDPTKFDGKNWRAAALRQALEKALGGDSPDSSEKAYASRLTTTIVQAYADNVVYKPSYKRPKVAKEGEVSSKGENAKGSPDTLATIADIVGAIPKALDNLKVIGAEPSKEYALQILNTFVLAFQDSSDSSVKAAVETVRNIRKTLSQGK